ncbi:MAG: polyisoprenoid-binding protein [Bacteroidetes bacterium]|nr:polyisoprenoid-binding protein [Bacteroidota bacterium]
MKNILKLLLPAIVFVMPVKAQSEWKLDAVHSSVVFSVAHMVISETSGNFKDFSIVLKSEKEDFSDAVIEAVIKVASINTENNYRDQHLRSNDFFNAEKYPEIRFKSKKFEKIDGNKYKITGDLTIRDVTKEAVFNAELKGVLKTENGLLSAWKAVIVIDRFEYNLKWNKTVETGGLVAGKVVSVVLNLEFTR